MIVADSSVLIHLSRIGKLDLLREYFKKILITPAVYDEIKEGVGASEITKACNEWITVVEPTTKDIERIANAEGIEKADASVIMLAKEQGKILISNDYALIAVAKSKGVDCWWLTTLLLNCIKQKILSKKEAKKPLLDLVKTGMHLNNAVYAAILNEIDQL
jgi:predicted nucleic acid-binding protein